MEASPATFLNLDLEVDAKEDLSPLSEHLKGRVFVLYCDSTETGFRLSLEPLIDGQLSSDPLACTENLVSLLEGPPEALASMWAASGSRVFDYGLDGGLEHPPMKMNLPPSMLARMASLGLDIRVTVYPFREGVADES